MGKGKIHASIELADLENYAQWREKTFCEDKSEARNEVAKKWRLPNWEELVKTLKSRQVPPAPRGKPGGAVSFELCFSRHEMFQALRKAGFDNVNLDLMFAIPGQTIAVWGSTLAEALAKQFEGLEVSFTRKSGENDQLFGSVTSGDIAEALEKKSFHIDRRKIQVHEPLKTIGEFTIPVKLHKDVTTHLKVVIGKEAAE